VTITIMGYGVVMCSSAVFNAIGKPMISFSYSILRSILLYIPLAFLATKLIDKESGIFYAIAASNVLAGIVAATYSLYKFRCIEQED
jgi:Na+-driven multidrug efflux pump